MPNASASSYSVMPNKPICKFYAKGNCKYGNSCKFAHIKNANVNSDIDNFTSAVNLGNKTTEIKEGLKDYGSIQSKPVLSSFGLGYPAVNNLISGRDFSFEEQRFLYLQAVASNSVEEYNRNIEGRAKDMDICVNYLAGKEQHAARYQQKSAEPNAGIPKPFVPMTLEENLNRIRNDPNGAFTSQITTPAPSLGNLAAGLSAFGSGGSQRSNPFSSQVANSPFDSSQKKQTGSLGFVNFKDSSSNNAAVGQTGFGNSAFGNSGFGQASSGQPNSVSSGFGSRGFGVSDFGQSGSNQPSARQSGFGQSGVGNSDFGKSDFGKSGFGQAGFGKSGFGNSGFGSSGFGNSGFGNSGFDNPGSGQSGFGKSGFGQSGFGQSGFGSSGFGNSGFGNSGFGNSGFDNPGSGQSGFGKSGFGQSGFGQSGFGQSGFGQSGFGQSGFGNSGFGNSGFGNSGFDLSKTTPASSGFGSSGFASSQPNPNSTGFGQSALGLSSKESSGVGAIANKSLAKEPAQGSPASGFGQSSFAKLSSEKPTFGNSSFGTNQPSPFLSTLVNQDLANISFNEKDSNRAQERFGVTPFGTSNSNATVSGASNTSIFGNNLLTTSETTKSLRNTQFQDISSADLKDYDERISQAFASAEFKLGEVPEVPPPITIC